MRIYLDARLNPASGRARTTGLAVCSRAFRLHHSIRERREMLWGPSLQCISGLAIFESSAGEQHSQEMHNVHSGFVDFTPSQALRQQGLVVFFR